VTYSVVVLDEASGALGVAAQSKVLAAGAGLAWAEAGVGAVATQAVIKRSYGPAGIALLRQGLAATDVIARLTQPDDLREHRQLAVVAAGGDSAAHTGSSCIAWAGHRLGSGIAAQGNILAGPRVVDNLFEEARSPGTLPERLVSALRAAESAGGDRRGRQAAALLVVNDGAEEFGSTIDLRVDDDDEPVERLAVLLAHHRLLSEQPTVTDLEPMTPALASELAALLRQVGATPDRLDSFQVPGLIDTAALEELGVERIGDPVPLPAGWDAGWQQALEGWMGLENLVARLAAPGWVDPLVVDHLRRRAASGPGR
jgi:uncharacterized Ntn-hydrolase superfamily protein